MATNFFQRWSSRKLATRDEVADSTPSDTDYAVDMAAADVHISDIKQQPSDNCLQGESSVESAEPVNVSEPEFNDEAATLTLKDVANVTFESGVTSFMKTGVEKSVKKAALRKLFHSDEFNYVSDMDDHTEDFSNVPALDSKVTKQLRNWVNQAAEKIEEVADTLNQIASEGTPEGGAELDTQTAEELQVTNPDSLEQAASSPMTAQGDSVDLAQVIQLDNEDGLGANDATLNKLSDRG